MIINFLKDLVKATIRKVLVTATLMITDFMLFLLMRAVKIAMKIYTSQEPSRETVHSVKNQNQKHPTRKTNRNQPVNQKNSQ